MEEVDTLLQACTLFSASIMKSSFPIYVSEGQHVFDGIMTLVLHPML